MLSAICFNLHQSKIFSSGSWLNLYGTVLRFYDHVKEGFRKQTNLKPAILAFLNMFAALSQIISMI